ncbi:hypothetical protein VKT23_006033 [Stygiomarasmius scandens]|uniref:Uncharacterized protein n=1 Tax=Marasmiellus scandens TaxID=2682957 RepID=A0ABR1JPZ8_9AGAR
MVDLRIDPSVTPTQSPPNYPHTRLLLNNALLFARQYALSHFFPVFDKVAQHLSWEHDPHVDPKPGDAALKFVVGFLDRPVDVQLDGMEEYKLSKSRVIGRPRLLIELADALEQCAVSDSQ